MKKNNKKLLALGLIFATTVTLAACANNKQASTSGSTTSTNKQSSSSSSSSSTSASSGQEDTFDNSVYDSVLTKYQDAIKSNQTDSSINPLIVTYANSTTSPASTVYTYRDLDKNGVDELVLSFKPGSLFSDYVITDIYTMSKDSGEVIRLTEGPQLGMLGERMNLAYLMDHTFSYYGSAGATSGGGSGYVFSDDGQSLVKTDSSTGDDEVDLSNWGWQDLNSKESDSSTSSSSSSQTSSTGLNANELAQGDYKSAVGTWQSSNGKTIEITSDGQLILWGYSKTISSVSANPYVTGVYSLKYQGINPTDNTPVDFYPSGVSGSGYSGDSSRDRILATNGVPDDGSVYYKVD